MGDEETYDMMKGGQLRLFFADTGEEVAMADNVPSLKLSTTEDADDSEKPDWATPGSYEITGTLSVDPKDAKRFHDMFFFTREERRKMFHAVTHGQAVVFVGNYNAEGHEPFQAPTYIDRPSTLRKALATVRHARFNYEIRPVRECTNFVHMAM